VAGLGEKGYTLAVALKHAGRRVVVIDRDERSPAVAGCRRRDIPVVVGDAGDPSLLARVRLDRARHFVIVTGDDRRNVEIAFAAEQPPGRLPLTALVHLDELALWRLLQAEAVAKRARLRLRLDFFNLRDAAARTMLDAHPPFPPSRDDELRAPHVLIVQSDRLGDSLVLRTAGLWQGAQRRPGEELSITLAGQGAESALALLLAREPKLRRLCALRALEIHPSSLAVEITHTQNGRPPISAVYVCLGSEVEALAVALALHGQPALEGVPIIVAVADERSGIALAVEGD
jgi:hypothetical protein